MLPPFFFLELVLEFHISLELYLETNHEIDFKLNYYLFSIISIKKHNLDQIQ